MRDAQGPRASTIGLAYGLAAYGSWGLLPLFWKQLGHVPALELLLHRVVWALSFLLLVIGVRGRFAEVRAALRVRNTRLTLILTAALVATNWFTFVYGIGTARVLHVSLGYFITPLVSVTLGLVVLRERLRPLQWVAVGLAAIGVAYMATRAGELPWISLLLAVTFGLYGLLRKTVRVEALPGTACETLILVVPSLLGIAWLESSGQGHFFSTDATTTLLMAMTGVISALPLWWFANAARRLALTSIGFLQYLAPSLHFLLAVFAFGETFTPAHGWTFGCIWGAVALFAADAWRARDR
jgi:chloramphenicol-sensitive protein RarD